MKKKLVLFTVGLSLMVSMNAQNWSGSTPGNIYYTQGKVGIGVTNPNFNLSLPGGDATISLGDNIFVNGAGSTGRISYNAYMLNGGWAFSNNSVYSATIELRNSGVIDMYGTTSVGQSSSWKHMFGIDAPNNKVYFPNGNIGIGTFNPESGIKLHLKGEENTHVIQLIEASTSNYMAGISLQSSGQRYSICTTRDQTGNFSIFDETHSAHRFTINSDGNIGIGTINPGSYKLNVAGSIRANEIKVNTTGADFVFEPTYKLRSLAEVETFINQHKHLPDVAPAAEMQTNGVSMGEMQAKLLQKVEETTLYLIEQQKTMEAILKQLEAVKKENELLKKQIQYVLQN